MSKKRIISLISLFYILFLGMTTVNIAFAAPIVPDCVVSDPKSCGLCDMLQLITNGIKYMSGAASGLALLMFVIGGFYWIFSMGNEQRVATGKKIITGSVVGILIIFLGFVIVNTTIIILSQGADFSGTATIFPGSGGEGWFNITCEQYK